MSNLEKETIEFFIYENKKMGDFLQLLGLEPDDITSYIINGDAESILKMKQKIKDNLCLS